MKYKAVVFDLDGTLVDTIYDLNKSSNYALKKYNYEEVTIDETRSFIGNGIRNLIYRSLKEDDTKLDLVLEAFKEHYNLNCTDTSKVYSGIYQLLDYLKNNNIILGVFSNKAITPLTKIVNHYFPNTFKFILGDMMGYKRKPDIDGLSFILENTNVDISEILYIGDSTVDINFAKNAKLDLVLVSHGFTAKNKLEQLNYGTIVDNPLDIIKLLS